MKDNCKGFRKGYNAFIALCASNNIIGSFLISSPIIYYLTIIGFQTYYTSPHIYMITNTSYGFVSVLSVSYCIGLLCILKTMPNLISIPIFVFKACGYWMLVSFMILIFYGFSILPSIISKYISLIILPEIILLLFSANIMREMRTKMFKKLEIHTTEVNNTVPTFENNV
jgi:hypothetical protein